MVMSCHVPMFPWPATGKHVILYYLFMVGLSATKLATPLGLPNEEGGGHPAGPKIRPVKGRMSSFRANGHPIEMVSQ